MPVAALSEFLRLVDPPYGEGWAQVERDLLADVHESALIDTLREALRTGTLREPVRVGFCGGECFDTREGFLPPVYPSPHACEAACGLESHDDVTELAPHARCRPHLQNGTHRTIAHVLENTSTIVWDTCVHDPLAWVRVQMGVTAISSPASSPASSLVGGDEVFDLLVGALRSFPLGALWCEDAGMSQSFETFEMLYGFTLIEDAGADLITNPTGLTEALREEIAARLGAHDYEGVDVELVYYTPAELDAEYAAWEAGEG